MDDEQPPTPSFRVLRQTNPSEMVDECEPTNYFLFTPHHPSLFSLLLLSLLLLLLAFDVHFLSFCIPIS